MYSKTCVCIRQSNCACCPMGVGKRIQNGFPASSPCCQARWYRWCACQACAWCVDCGAWLPYGNGAVVISDSTSHYYSSRDRGGCAPETVSAPALMTSLAKWWQVRLATGPPAAAPTQHLTRTLHARVLSSQQQACCAVYWSGSTLQACFRGVLLLPVW
jgi:hypothetical protein